MLSRMGAALVVAVLIGSGCYVYEPVRPADAILDARVRATVTAEQAAELAPVLRGVTPRVTGKLVERTEQGVLLEVPLYADVAGLSRTVRNRVAIPFDQLVGLEGRRLSKWRTAVSVGAVVAGVAGGWAVVSGAESAGDKEKTDIDNAIITIFRLPVALFR